MFIIVYESVEEKTPFNKPLRVEIFEDIVNNGHFMPTLSLVFRKSALPEIPSCFSKLWAGHMPLILLVTHYGKNYHFDDVMGFERKKFNSNNPK